MQYKKRSFKYLKEGNQSNKEDDYVLHRDNYLGCWFSEIASGLDEQMEIQRGEFVLNLLFVDYGSNVKVSKDNNETGEPSEQSHTGNFVCVGNVSYSGPPNIGVAF